MKIVKSIAVGIVLSVSAMSCATATETTTMEGSEKVIIHLASAQILKREITAVIETPHFLEKTNLHEQLVH